MQRAALKMKDKNVSSLLVNDKDDKPIGLITERDLARKVCIQDAYTSKITTKEIMSSPLITIRSGSSPSEAIDAMLQNNVRHLLVSGVVLLELIPRTYYKIFCDIQLHHFLILSMFFHYVIGCQRQG